MRGLLLAVLLAACTPVASVGSPGPTAASADPLPARSPTAAAPSATATEAAAPTPGPTTAPTPGPTTAPTAPPPPPDANAHNEKQWIVVDPDPPLGFHTGEAPVAATMVSSYTLNGESLAGSTVQCAQLAQDVCSELRILPATPLVGGERYELALLGTVIASFTARGLVAATPHAISATATQYELTIAFDRPMLSVSDCGTRSWTLIAPGTVSYVRSASTTWPPMPGAYTSSNAGYRDFLAAFVSEAVPSDDCTAVTLRSGWGAPTGTFDLTVSGVEDEDGNVAPDRTFTLDIADEAPPKLMFAQLELQTAEKKVIRVAYSEAMDEEYVTDPERYLLNGTLLPAGTTLACEVADCAWVGITFPPTAFAYGADNTLTIVGVRDTVGLPMSPDIVTSGAFQVR